MFGLFKKKATDLDLEMAIAELAAAEQTTRSMVRKLMKDQEETDRVLKRMVSELQSLRSDVGNLMLSDLMNSDLVLRIEELERVCEGNTELICDTAEQTKIHQRQVAGLYRRLDKLETTATTKVATHA